MSLRRAFSLLLLVPALALAHPADVLQLRVGRGAAEGELVERLTLSVETALLLAPLDEDGDGRLTPRELEAGAAALRAGVWDELPAGGPLGPCRRLSERARLGAGGLELEADLACPTGELWQEFKVLRVLPPSYHLELWGPDDEAPLFAQGPTRLRLRGPRRVEAGSDPGLALLTGVALGGGLAALAWRRWRPARRPR
jgi:hypothetical protein